MCCDKAADTYMSLLARHDSLVRTMSEQNAGLMVIKLFSCSTQPSMKLKLLNKYLS